MNAADTARLQQFLGGVLNGAVDLGIGALPLLALYRRAKDEKLDFWQLVLTDEAMATTLVRKMRMHAGKLPDSVVSALKLVIEANTEAKVQKKATAQASHPQPAHPRSADHDAP